MIGADSVMPIGRENPNIARVYNCLLGGAHNFEVDRDTAQKLIETWPGIQGAARVNRTFPGEAVRYLASPAGIRQTLDIGSGIPTMVNVDEVAQEMAPDVPVAYDAVEMYRRTTAPFQPRSRAGAAVLRRLRPGGAWAGHAPGLGEHPARWPGGLTSPLPLHAGVGRLR